MKTLILLIVASTLLPISAQNKATRRVRHVATPQSSSQSTLPSLKENHTITLKGVLSTGDPIDLSLTGIGPTFLSDQVLGKNDSIFSCSYTVEAIENGYHLTYSVGARLKFETSKNDKTTNYAFRDVTIQGKIHCTLGVPVVISKNGEKQLLLTISKIK